MKECRGSFLSFHTLYRLITSFTDMQNLATGIARLYKRSFCASKVVIILKDPGHYRFLKVVISEKMQLIKRGTKSILTKKEKKIINQDYG